MAKWIQLLVRDSGPVRVHVSADYFVDFPVEVWVPTGPLYIGSRDLGLNADLESELLGWQRWFSKNTSLDTDPIERGVDAEWDAWRQRGVELTQRLSEALGLDFDVRLV